MPTLPPENVPPTPPEPHRQRLVAESFGADAERYDRTRPRYPEALVRRIATASPGPDLLDVGCGTGIAARQFLAAGYRVLGVEPDARMAVVARQFGLPVEEAGFEGWDPAGRKFDVVVAGQAWHWIDPVAGAAKAASVLRPGGLLAAFWNVFELPPEVLAAVDEVCARVLPDSPFRYRAEPGAALQAYDSLLARAAEGIRAAGGLGEPEQWRQDWAWTCTRDAWLDQMPTQGAFTRLPPEQLAEVLAAAGAAIDALGGSFPMRYTTVALIAVRG